eukprot:scaffold2334_cov118-Cylindrotheca_fusiformis.AAC.36
MFNLQETPGSLLLIQLDYMSSTKKVVEPMYGRNFSLDGIDFYVAADARSYIFIRQISPFYA